MEPGNSTTHTHAHAGASLDASILAYCARQYADFNASYKPSHHLYKTKTIPRVRHEAGLRCTCSAEGPDCFPALLLFPVPLLLFAAMLK